MSTPRNALWVVAGVLLATFSLSGTAGPTKQYSLLIQANPSEVPPAVATPTLPLDVTVYVKNESPPNQGANSNIGSFQFTLEGMSILALTNGTPTTAGPSCPPGASCTLNGNTITVTNIASLQAQQIFPVTFTVNSCGEGNVPAATTLVYNGSGLTGQPFSGPQADGNFFNAGPGGPFVASSSTQNVLCGSLDCSTQFTVPANDGTGSGNNACTNDPTSFECVIGFRSISKDGFCANGTVSYTVTNTLATADDTLHVEWAIDPAGAFAYKVNLPSNANPNFAWLLDGNGNPYFIPADNCIGYPSTVASLSNPPLDLLPHQITTLSGDVSTTANKIKVQSTSGLSTGMDIVIGPYLDGQGNITIERMTVGSINTQSNQVNVTRAVGGTSKSFHPSGAPVMTTPMNKFANTIGPYQKNDQRQMCIAQGPTSNGDVPETFYIWVIDIGDGFTRP